MRKILITGGHLTPALAEMSELKKREWQIYYIGRKNALEGDAAISQEYRIITSLGYPFQVITAGRWHRDFNPLKSLFSLFKIPLGFWQAFVYIKKLNPQAILSFGGYVALPVAISGWLWGIPVVTHEQTFVPGLANRIIGFFCRKICVSWAKTQKYFPQTKTVLTGIPLRPELFQASHKLPITHDKPVIYITGGNLGAHSLNLVVAEALPQLLEHYTVIHQCGNAQKYRDFEYLVEKQKTLVQPLRERYFVYEYIDSAKIGWVFKHADLIVSRAGANVICEIITLGKLAILVPLPWSGGGEQEQNAKYLTEANAARMLLQPQLTVTRLLTEIIDTLAHKEEIYKNLQSLGKAIVPDAAAKIADVIESVM